MNKEIKEIPENVKFVLEDVNSNILWNYITNLQQENERLKEILIWKQEHEKELHTRIDKAIEYIEDMPYLQETDEEFEDIYGNIYHTWKEWTADVLLNILQNGNDDE